MEKKKINTATKVDLDAAKTVRKIQFFYHKRNMKRLKTNIKRNTTQYLNY